MWTQSIDPSDWNWERDPKRECERASGWSNCQCHCFLSNVLCCAQLFVAATPPSAAATTTTLPYIIWCRYFAPNIPHQKLIVKIDDGFSSLLASFNSNSNYSLSSSSYTNTEWACRSGRHDNNSKKSRALFYAYYDKFQYKNIISLLFVRHTHTLCACYKMSKFCVWCVCACIIFIDSNGAKQLTTDYFLFVVDLWVFCFCSFVRLQQNEHEQLRVFPPSLKFSFSLSLPSSHWLLLVRQSRQKQSIRAAYTSVLIVHIWHNESNTDYLVDLFTISNDDVEFYFFFDLLLMLKTELEAKARFRPRRDWGENAILAAHSKLCYT